MQTPNILDASLAPSGDIDSCPSRPAPPVSSSSSDPIYANASSIRMNEIEMLPLPLPLPPSGSIRGLAYASSSANTGPASTERHNVHFQDIEKHATFPHSTTKSL